MEAGDSLKKIGITLAVGEVYETEDLPEDDQQILNELIASQELQTKSEFLESSRLDMKEAFKLFSDKTIESNDVDFSDNIAHPKIGYKVSDLASQPKSETVMEKYERLKKCISQLQDEVNIVKSQTNNNDDSSNETLQPANMNDRVLYLQKELSRINLGSSSCSGGLDDDATKVSGADNDAQVHYHRKLMNELNCFLSSSSTSTSSSAPSSSSNDALRYNIYSSAGQMKHEFNALISDIEQRIDRCEAVLGINSEKCVYTGDSEEKTFMGALSLVVAKFTLLDLSQLNYFDSSLLAIQQKLLQASVKVEASDVADKVDSMIRTYETLKKSDAKFDKLIEVVGRLNSLNDVHQSAMQFNKALNHVSESQKVLVERLQDHSEHLKQIQALQVQQMQQFDSNCKFIEELSSS